VLLSILASGNYRWQENPSHPLRGWLLTSGSSVFSHLLERCPLQKMLAAIVFGSILAAGCAGMPPVVTVDDSGQTFASGTILSSEIRTPISYETLINELADSRVVYIGEVHTEAAHHEIQLKIIRSLTARKPQSKVGMEMFDFTYQPVLVQWSAGELEREVFLKKTQWNVNWGFDFGLYESILNFVRNEKLPLIGLNVPTFLPSRVRVGGLENLLARDRELLPSEIDTTNEAHRAFVKETFERHHFLKATHFEFFYQAQCLWEDGMAESIARNLGDASMIVVIGNGHIIFKFGVPDRAYRRTGASFRTVYLAPAGSTVEWNYADYIWVTPVSE
jgi:uncharacterized iron-regulated protein